MHHSTLTTIQANGRAHHRLILDRDQVPGLGKVVSLDPTRMGLRIRIRVGVAPEVVKKKVVVQNRTNR